MKPQADALQHDFQEVIQKMTLLKKEQKELQAAQIHSQGTFTVELHEKNEAKKEELERIRFPHTEISQRYETDLLSPRKEMDRLSLSKRSSRRCSCKKNTRTLDFLQETFKAGLQVESKKNKLLLKEEEKVTSSSDEDCSKLPKMTNTPSIWKRV